MSQKVPASRKSLSHLLQDLEDGVITASDCQHLNELMRQKPAVRQQYLRHFEMSALLQETSKSRAEFGGLPVSQQTLKVEKRRSAFQAVTYAIAAMLLIGLVFLAYRTKLKVSDLPSGVAMEISSGTAYSVAYAEEGERPDKRLYPGDRLTLTQGVVRMEFASGVEAIVEGPSDIELHSEVEVHMDGGRAWFKVPEAGRGFAVSTKKARIVDYGTEFGVWFDPQAGLQVHVGKGRVKASSTALGGAEVDMLAGDAIRYDEQGESEAVDFKLDHFRRSFSLEIPYIHWSFDELKNGAFSADGPLAESVEYDAVLKRLDGNVALGSSAAHQSDGAFGKAFAMKGNGTFAESLYRGAGDRALRTIAAWVRHRGGAILHGATGLGTGPEQAALPTSAYGTQTPWGEQAYLLNYTNAAITTSKGVIPAVLEAGMTYTLSFQAGLPPKEEGGSCKVQFVVFDADDNDHARELIDVFPEENVLAEKSEPITSYDLGQRGQLVFRPRAGDERIGKELGIRITKANGSMMYDEVRLTVRPSRKAGSQRLLFYEGFESPSVRGFAVNSLPDKGWVGARERYGARARGIYNERPVYSAPYCAWSRTSSEPMWAAFMDNAESLHWCVASGNSWVASMEQPELKRGEWVHIASVYTGRLTSSGDPEIYHYINGVRQLYTQAYEIFSGDAPNQTLADGPMRFGALLQATIGDDTADGDLDEFYIFRGALSDKQVVRLMEFNHLH